MSYRPHPLGRFSPTGCGLPPEFLFSQARSPNNLSSRATGKGLDWALKYHRPGFPAGRHTPIGPRSAADSSGGRPSLQASPTISGRIPLPRPKTLAPRGSVSCPYGRLALCGRRRRKTARVVTNDPLVFLLRYHVLSQVERLGDPHRVSWSLACQKVAGNPKPSSTPLQSIPSASPSRTGLAG